MKKLSTLFQFVGFIVQYIIPIVLFGDIVPYTKEGIGKCLSGMGYVAVGLALYFLIKKLKEWILQKPKSLKRALILSVFPIVIWLAVMLGLDFLSAFILKLSNYWDKVILFIVLGRVCYTISEVLYQSAEEGDDQ